ncbi:universal stress protein [bacterium]|nr:universal stress protein [bacterium]
MKIDMLLYPTDFSSSAEMALDYAIFLAKRYRAVVALLHVNEFASLIDPNNAYGYRGSYQLKDEVEKVAKEKLRKLAGKIEKKVKVKTYYSEGAAYDQIVRLSEKEKIGMIVMGTRGRSFLSDYYMGSTAERVMALTKCPVLTVHGKYKEPPFKKILLFYDFSEVSELTLSKVMAMVRDFESEIILCHPDEMATEERVVALSKFLEGFDLRGIVVSKRSYAESDGYGGIVKCAGIENADLIVFGKDSRVGRRHVFLEGISEEIIRYAHQPVWILPTQQ